MWVTTRPPPYPKTGRRIQTRGGFITMRKRIKFLAGPLLLGAMFAAYANAQTATATLKGSVADGSGQVTPGAMVTLTQTSTGLKRKFTVSEDGQCTFSFLEPGAYRLE